MLSGIHTIMSEKIKQIIAENQSTGTPHLDLGNYIVDGTEKELEMLVECDHLRVLILSRIDQRLGLNYSSKEENQYDHKVNNLLSKDYGSNKVSNEQEIIQIPPYLPKNLKRLICNNHSSSGGIQSLAPLSSLNDLEMLHLSYNQIHDILDLEYLIKLTSLDLSHNQIENPLPLKHLGKLIFLDLSVNKIKDISFLIHLKELKTLKLAKNEIQDLSPIANLRQLEYLDLSSNQILDFSLLSQLTKLKTLKLNNNQLERFPEDFLNQCKELDSIYLHNNDIQNLPLGIFNEPYKNALENLRTYFRYGKNVKVILIGNAGVGKTQIARTLSEHQNSNLQHSSTNGIKLFKRELKGLILHIWDFSGKKDYQIFHHFFMQTRALFVLIWDIKNQDLSFWLEYIRYFGKDNPILAVQNKVDREIDLKSEIINQIRESYEKDYSIVKFLQISAKTKYNWDQLEDSLVECFLQQEKLKEDLVSDVSPSWNNIYVQIRQLQNKKKKIFSLREFKDICRNEGEIKDIVSLLDYLYNRGVFYYHKGYLKDIIILDQVWFIDIIYSILDRQVEGERLTYNDLKTLCRDIKDEEIEIFIHFITRAKLCFETDHQLKLIDKSLVLPQLLPNRKPQPVISFEEEKEFEHFTMNAIIRYDFLPTIFIQRFITHIYCSDVYRVKYFWQKGIWFEHNKAYVIVEANYFNNKFIIQANDPILIHKVKEEIDSIVNENSGQNAEYVSMIKAISQSVSKKETSSFDQIKQKAICYLEDANYTDCFSELDKAREEMIPEDINQLSTLKKEFISGKNSTMFAARLSCFIQDLKKK